MELLISSPSGFGSSSLALLDFARWSEIRLIRMIGDHPLEPTKSFFGIYEMRVLHIYEGKIAVAKMLN